MKKIIALLLIFASSSGYCVSQPHSLGIVTMSTAAVTGSFGLWPQPVASIASLISTATGQMLWCTNCGSVNGGLGTPCISTGGYTTNTIPGQFIICGSSLTAVTVCK